MANYKFNLITLFNQMPKALGRIKGVQLLFALTVFGLALYIKSVCYGSASVMSIMTGLLSLALFWAFAWVSSWVTILVIECIALFLWLTTLSLWVYWDYYAIQWYIACDIKDDCTPWTPSELVHHGPYLYYVDRKKAVGTFSTALGLSLIQVVLYCTSLAMLWNGVHKYKHLNEQGESNVQRELGIDNTIFRP